MRRLTLAQVVLNVAAFSALFLSVACAGLKAREYILVPAMSMAWTGISADVNVGIAGLTVDGASDVRTQQQRMSAALDAGDIQGVLMVDWARLRATAELGILRRRSRGEIGPGVAESLRERLRMFTQAFLKLEQEHERNRQPIQVPTGIHFQPIGRHLDRAHRRGRRLRQTAHALPGLDHRRAGLRHGPDGRARQRGHEGRNRNGGCR